jgi:hypothetical protein
MKTRLLLQFGRVSAPKAAEINRCGGFGNTQRVADFPLGFVTPAALRALSLSPLLR